jgi:hypothetical protein
MRGVKTGTHVRGGGLRFFLAGGSSPGGSPQAAQLTRGRGNKPFSRPCTMAGGWRLATTRPVLLALSLVELLLLLASGELQHPCSRSAYRCGTRQTAQRTRRCGSCWPLVAVCMVMLGARARMSRFTHPRANCSACRQHLHNCVAGWMSCGHPAQLRRQVWCPTTGLYHLWLIS